MECCLNYIKLPTSSKRYVLISDEQSYLSGVYSLMYPEETITAINITGRKYTHVSGPVFIFESNGKSSQRKSYVLANWPQQSLVNTNNPDDFCPGQVQYFLMHSISLNSVLHPHLFAMYFGMSPIQMLTSIYGKPLPVWYKNYYQARGPSTFIPIQRIANCFIFYCDEDSEEMIICPLVSKSHSD